MTWEETIQFIRRQPEYKGLVETAYFEEDLELNIRRFKESLEWKETLKIIRTQHPTAQTVLDIGSGNGISAVSFALEGYQVTALEPDPSETIGAGAIRWLKSYYQLDTITIIESFAENMPLVDSSFDVVYSRQAMHHAFDLNSFVSASAKVLKQDGLFLTVRDHVIFDEKDKEWFLEMHPLQKFYKGENAFTPTEYREAISKAGLKLKQEIKFYENVVNYYPMNRQDLQSWPVTVRKKRRTTLESKIGVLSRLPFLDFVYNFYLNYRVGKAFDEKLIPGRLYSYVATKL